MKKIFSILLTIIVCSLPVLGQNGFEGRITYGIKMLGEGADQYAAFMPESYEYAISGDKISFKMNGGMVALMMGRFIVDQKAGVSYMIKDSEQIAYKITADSEENELTKPRITKLDEIITVAGYKCQKYEMVVIDKDSGEEVKTYVWVTDQIKVAVSKNAKMKAGGDIFIEGIDGFPLKMMTLMGEMSMVLTATNVKKEAIDKSEFIVPKDYEIQDFDPAMFGY